MSGTTDCERMEALAAELALGITDGEERAWALEHLAGCASCRAHVERLASVADELLLLAPPAEPPAGFEGRIADRLGPAPRRAARSRRFALPALAAAAAAAVAAAVVWFAGGDDRDLADDYRQTLAVANGEYFDAASLEAADGEKVGYLYGYQGRASWVFAVVFDGLRDGDYRLVVVTDKGAMRLRELTVEGGSGSTGSVIPFDFDDLAMVRIIDLRGREVADAEPE